jgi:predicted HTH transcriptional regulator
LRPRNDQEKTAKRPTNDQQTTKKRTINDQQILSNTEYANTILGSMRVDDSITTKKLVDTLKISETKIKGIISQLKAGGKLERVGATKNGRWIVIAKD